MINKKKFGKIIKQKWHVQGFNACMNYIFHAAYSGLIDCHAEVGYGYTQKLWIFKKDYVEYHYLENDFKNVGQEFMKKYQQNKKYLKKLLDKESIRVREAMDLLVFVDKQKLSRLNKQELIDLYQKLWGVYHRLVGVSHLIEPITFVAEPMLKAKLEKTTKLDRHSKEFRQLFTDLLQPERSSFINEEQLNLMKIIKRINSDKKSSKLFKLPAEKIIKKLDPVLIRLILAHKRKFYYFQLNYYFGESLTEIDYLKEIKKLIQSKIDPNKFIKDEKERYKQNNLRRDLLIQEYNIDKDTYDLINLIMIVLHWQDDRKKYMLSCVYHINTLMKEISRKYKIDLDLLKRYMPMDITHEHLSNFDKQDAKAREKQFMTYLTRKNNRLVTEILVGDDFKDFMRLYLKKRISESDLHGMAASVGSATGFVKVCKTKKDLDKVNKGDVLVASMTRPEFVPAMRKAAAIITDEGGITCHAAIVSRELGIPCVIGTKTATKVLKDGDLVEVAANHGIVKKVK